MYMQNLGLDKMVSEYLTIGIPVRIDNAERLMNLSTVIKYLSPLQCRILVLEADAQPQVRGVCDNDLVDYNFIEDTKSVFHRTHYINKLLLMAKTKLVAIWDTDILVEYNQIVEALQILVQKEATIVYPYDGRFIMLPEHLSVQVRHNIDFDYLRSLKLSSMLGRKLCGGAYIVHRSKYLQCGGENERFTGWGPEDAERMHRVKILGHSVYHISSGELFHLYHPRTASNYQSIEDATSLREEFIKVCCMLPNELKLYIQK